MVLGIRNGFECFPFITLHQSFQQVMASVPQFINCGDWKFRLTDLYFLDELFRRVVEIRDFLELAVTQITLFRQTCSP